ncbi:hypothetical protein N665_0071s0015 [Sinapis alba]|nr:hypothetical protein N665_0071s0015 [Sinapis alba]
MGISKNILITFVFTIFFIVSNVHCYPVNFWIHLTLYIYICYGPCNQRPAGCERFCGAMSIQLVGECNSGICCCRSKRPN